jgi:hypothetical protein
MKKTKIPDLLAGDIILSRQNTWLSKAIRWVTSIQTGKAEYSHVACALGRGFIIEALWKITVGDVKKYEGQEIQVWRLPLTDKQRRDFEHGMLLTAGGAYGLGKIPLFALDALGTKIKSVFGHKEPCFWFTKTFGVTNIPVCSQLAVWGLQKHAGFEILDEDGVQVNWKTVSPDRLHDLLKHKRNNAELIFKGAT